MIGRRASNDWASAGRARRGQPKGGTIQGCRWSVRSGLEGLAALLIFLAIDLALGETLIEYLASAARGTALSRRAAAHGANYGGSQDHQQHEQAKHEQRTEPHAAPASSAPTRPPIVHHLSAPLVNSEPAASARQTLRALERRPRFCALYRPHYLFSPGFPFPA